MAWHDYNATWDHNLFVVCYTSKLVADIHTLFYYRKMCECTQISYEKCDKIGEYSYEKMWMMLTLVLICLSICVWKYGNVYIYIHKAAYCL